MPTDERIARRFAAAHDTLDKHADAGARTLAAAVLAAETGLPKPADCDATMWHALLELRDASKSDWVSLHEKSKTYA
jgi:hypothetical protein